MKTNLIAAILALAVMPCSAQEAGHVRMVRRGAPPVFAWPAPASAQVIERISHKGKITEIRYTLQVTEERGTRHLLVRRRDFQMVKYEGAAVRSEVDRKLALFRAAPDLRVSRKGKVLNAAGQEKARRRAIDALMKEGDKGRAFRDVMRKMLADPELQLVLEWRMRDAWHAWVEGWLLPDAPPPGATRRFQMKMPAMLGRVVKAQVVARNRGMAKTHPGHVWLTANVQYDPAELRRSMEGVFIEKARRNRAGSEAPQPKFQPGDLESFKLAKRFDVVLDPRTLRPARCFYELLHESKVKRQAPERGAERHDYFFNWSVR